MPWYLFFTDHYRSFLITGVVSVSIYFLYFINLRAYFKNNFKLENKTHFVYDLLNVFNYLFFLYVLLSFANYFGLTRMISIAMIVMAEIFFYFICSTRYYERIIKKLLIIGIILIGFNILVIAIFDFSFLKILVLTMGSYINYIIFNKKYLHKDYSIDRKDYSEGILIQIISLVFAFLI
jgi:hypothetical protein